EAIELKDYTVPEGYFLEVLHEWEDEEGTRVKYEFITKMTDAARDSLPKIVVQTMEETRATMVAPQWDFIDRSKPTKISPLRRKQDDSRMMKCALIGGDPQIHFLALDNGDYIPTHDDAAIDVFMQVAEYLQPDVSIWTGDFLDLPS